MSDQAIYISPEEQEVMKKRDAERLIEYRRAIELMKILDIPCMEYSLSSDYIPPTIYAIDLYDILMDEEKLQAIVSKLKLKAFW